MQKPGGPPGCPVQFVQALRRAHPEIAAAILVNSIDGAAGQAGRIPRIVFVMKERPRSGIQSIKAAGSPEPQRAANVLVDTSDSVRAKASLDAGFMPVMREDAPGRVNAVDAVESSSNPENTVPIFEQGADLVTADSVRVGGIVAVLFKNVAVIPEQAGIARKPDETLIVLRNGTHPRVEGLTTRGEPDEADVLPVDDRKPIDAARQCSWDRIGSNGAQQKQGINEQVQVQRKTLPCETRFYR